MLKRHQVEKVFGYPGGAILPVFDAIYNSPHFDFVLPRHEQGAGHIGDESLWILNAKLEPDATCWAMHRVTRESAASLESSS